MALNHFEDGLLPVTVTVSWLFSYQIPAFQLNIAGFVPRLAAGSKCEAPRSFPPGASTSSKFKPLHLVFLPIDLTNCSSDCYTLQGYFLAIKAIFELTLWEAFHYAQSGVSKY